MINRDEALWCWSSNVAIRLKIWLSFLQEGSLYHLHALIIWWFHLSEKTLPLNQQPVLVSFSSQGRFEMQLQAACAVGWGFKLIGQKNKLVTEKTGFARGKALLLSPLWTLCSFSSNQEEMNSVLSYFEYYLLWHSSNYNKCLKNVHILMLNSVFVF